MLNAGVYVSLNCGKKLKCSPTPFFVLPHLLVPNIEISIQNGLHLNMEIQNFDVYLTVHHSRDFSNYQLNAQFVYSSTICMLHYAPQHVSNSTLLILRRTNCITTASGIVTLCKQPYSMQVDSGLQSALHLHTVRL